jgi:RimJ/RimL family protein N-acetyltransferase
MIDVRFYGNGSTADNNKLVGDFVSLAIFGELGRISNYCSMAVFDDERMIAGVLYNNYQPREGVIEMHAASIDRRWLTRLVLREMFSLPFDQYGCQLCALRVSETNKHMIRIAKAYGFKEHVIPRLRGRDEAEHILTLSDDDWRSNRFNKGMH